MCKNVPETVQWIKKVRILWKNGLNFKLKRRNAQKSILCGRFGALTGRSGDLMTKIGDSQENRESWQVWVLMHQSIPAAPEHLPHPQVWPWGWQRPDPRAGQNLLMPHPRDDKAAMAGWMQLSLTDASTMNRISLENNCFNGFKHIKTGLYELFLEIFSSW